MFGLGCSILLCVNVSKNSQLFGYLKLQKPVLSSSKKKRFDEAIV